MTTDGKDLATVHESVLRAQQVQREGVNGLRDIFDEDPRLIISPNNKCANACLHCVADSTPQGATLPYDKFTRIDERFFRMFSVADFGRRGNPLLYNSQGHGLTDLLVFLSDQGIEKFTLALAIQGHATAEIERLERFAKYEKKDIETMVTYHHYFVGLDIRKLAQDFNSTLKNYSRFSKSILISLLGDNYQGPGLGAMPTKSGEVQESFKDNWEMIFSGIELRQDTVDRYHAIYAGREFDIRIPSIDERVYPLGRFRQHLEGCGRLDSYEKEFEKSMGDYACPDLIKWPGIIIEPDGSLNLCASFEAINCRGAIISNIFDKSYKRLEQELMRFHKKELGWFIDNLQEIIERKVSTCKMKNNCYTC